VVAISPQLEQYGRETIRQHKLTFELLSDKGNRVAEQFGLVFKLPDDLRQIYLKFGIDLEKFNGDSSWTLPIPGKVVVDSRSIVRVAEADPDYTVRPEPSQLIETLRVIANA